MSVYRTRTTCRICGSPNLITTLDLGDQCLAGQFPLPDEPDPPKAPLHLLRCGECGLVQLRHTVDPALMFGKYFYRSGVSATMRTHLEWVAREACEMLPGGTVAPRILDIGGNDGHLLNAIPVATGQRVIVDPSDVPVAHPGISVVRTFFPEGLLLTTKFDLIFSVACFYDTEDPVAFAAAVKKSLAPAGLWVCEVADLFAMLQNVAFDAVVHEHLLYLSPYTFTAILQRVGLKVVRVVPSESNGGSMRYYVGHRDNDAYEKHPQWPEWQARVGALWIAGRSLAEDNERYERFAADARRAVFDLAEYVGECRGRDQKIHILGASTKGNTVWQRACLNKVCVEAASDRDPRKAGRRCPGTNIPIITEEASRQLKPDVYLVGPSHFSAEIIAREKAAGTKAFLVFPLPELRIVSLTD